MPQPLIVQLADIEDRLWEHIGRVDETLSVIAAAIEDSDAGATQAVANAGRTLAAGIRRIDEELLQIVARWAPVASDLRVVLALIKLDHHLTLISNQFRLIAEQLIEIDRNLREVCGTAQRTATMARLAASQVGKAVIALLQRDLDLARAVNDGDDAIDRLNRDVFAASLDERLDTDQRELVMRHVLISRSLERIGDNAVDIAQQTGFVITAKLEPLTTVRDAGEPPIRRA